MGAGVGVAVPGTKVRPVYNHEFPVFTGIVRSIKYKPGWDFDVVVPDEELDRVFPGYLPMLRILATVPHRDNPATSVVVEARAPIPFAYEDMDLGVIYRWIREVAVGLELHEVDEWFLVDGVRVFDPHAVRHVEGAVPDGLK